MKGRPVLIIGVVATALMWIAVLVQADSQCRGALVVRAWPPGWACVIAVP